MKVCPRCQAQNYPQNYTCFHCGLVLVNSQPAVPPPYQAVVQPSFYPPSFPAQNAYPPANYYDPNQLSAKEKISDMVNLYITEGYYVVSRTDDSVQLKKDKQFSGCVAVFLFLCFLLPFFIYLIIHATMRDKLVYITALPDGSLEITDDKGNVEFCADPDDWEVPSETDYALWFAVGVVVIEFILVIIFFRSLLGIFS